MLESPAVIGEWPAVSCLHRCFPFIVTAPTGDPSCSSVTWKNLKNLLHRLGVAAKEQRESRSLGRRRCLPLGLFFRSNTMVRVRAATLSQCLETGRAIDQGGLEVLIC